MTICPMMLDRTFFETSDAVGRFGKIRGYGSVRPTIKSAQFAWEKGARGASRRKSATAVSANSFEQEQKEKRTCDGHGDDNEQIDVQKLSIPTSVD